MTKNFDKVYSLRDPMAPNLAPVQILDSVHKFQKWLIWEKLLIKTEQLEGH